MTCTFFGHRDTPAQIKPRLRQVIIDLIEHHGITQFYVGNQGSFDTMARSLLTELARIYPIHYAVVLAYLPKENDRSLDGSHTILPDGFEVVPPRFAIDYRKADYQKRHNDNNETLSDCHTAALSCGVT